MLMTVMMQGNITNNWKGVRNGNLQRFIIIKKSSNRCNAVSHK